MNFQRIFKETAKVLKQFILFFALLNIGKTVFGQVDALKPVPVLVEEIANANVFEITETVGFAGQKSNQYHRYRLLAGRANSQQLFELASVHTNPVVRLYAFFALREIAPSLIPDLKEKMNSDDATVVVVKGCTKYVRPVNTMIQEKLPATIKTDD